MVAATDEVISTRPAPRSTIGGSSRLARWTTAVTLTAISRRSSVRGMSRVKSPLTPIPALSAAASRGRPPSVTAAHSRSTPSSLDRSALTARTDAPVPARPASAAASSSSSAVMIKSKPLLANWRASSSPIPLDAPVTNASCCMGHRSLVGSSSSSSPLPRPSRPVTEVRSAHPRPMPRPGAAMVEGWLDAVTDTTIWGRVTGEDVDGPVPLRIEVDGRLWGYARAAHVDPEGGPWRFAVAHHLADGQAVSVSAVLSGQEPVLLEGSPRPVPASAPPRGRLEAVTATDVVGWVVADDYDGPITVALYVDGTFWTRVAADRPRPDLEPDGAAAHGFSVPHTLLPGQQVEAWALEVRSDGSRATATRSPWPGRRRPPRRATWPRGWSTRRSPTRPGRSPST